MASGHTMKNALGKFSSWSLTSGFEKNKKLKKLLGVNILIYLIADRDNCLTIFKSLLSFK